MRRKLSPAGAAVGALNGTIIALDVLPMEPIEGVHFIQGDFSESGVLAQLEDALRSRQADVVDTARIAHLIELAIDFSQAHLKPEGALVAKVFHGAGYNELLTLFKANFRTVKPLKPKASRDRSSETFLVGIGLKKPA